MIKNKCEKFKKPRGGGGGVGGDETIKIGYIYLLHVFGMSIFLRSHETKGTCRSTRKHLH